MVNMDFDMNDVVKKTGVIKLWKGNIICSDNELAF